MKMLRRYRGGGSHLCLLVGGVPVMAADKASAQEAKAMLERAVVAVKTDETKALAAFQAGGDGFRDRDLYVFCARTDGIGRCAYRSEQIGRNIKDLYDVDGVAFGQEMMAIAAEGQIKAVAYMWPEPGSHTPTAKISFVTRVSGQMCGVGYYK